MLQDTLVRYSHLGLAAVWEQVLIIMMEELVEVPCVATMGQKGMVEPRSPPALGIHIKR